MDTDLFTGDRRDFPQNVAPFPDSLSSPAAAIRWPEDPIPPMINHRPNPPPQKLRPIRYNSRSPACSQPAPEDPMEFTEVVEFLNDQPCPVNGESSEYFVPPPVKPDSAEIRDFDRGGGNGNWLGHHGPDPRDVLEGRVLEELSSFSSDSGNNDSTGSVKEPANQKRKRKARRKMEVFVENLVAKVMEKQDSMHKKLIEMIETTEKERIAREEEWRRQETERLKRDEEARNQEMSRNLSLISIIRNVLGQESDLPPSTPLPSSMEDNGGKNTTEDGDTKKDIEATKSGSISRKWPEAEVQALIMLRKAMESQSRVPGSSIWDEISIGMHRMCYTRSAKKCKEKWENINRYYRKSNKNHLDKTKRSAYFQDLSSLYGTGQATASENSKMGPT